MAEKLLVYLNTRSEDVQWAITAHSDGSVIDEGVGKLSSLTQFTKGRYVVAILPSDEVFLSSINVPTKNINKARLATPSQLEEVVSEDIDALHFALAKGDVPEQYPVAVIAKQRLALYASLFNRAELRVDAMLPSVLALPLRDNFWGVLPEADEYVVRTDPFKGFVCEPSLMPVYLNKSAQALSLDEESSIQPELLVYLESDSLAERASGHLINEQGDAWGVSKSAYRNPMWVFADGLKDGVPLNLLQGEYKPVRAQSAMLKNWLPTLALVGVGLLLWFGYTIYDGFRLKSENKQMEANIERLYKKAFPGSRMVDPSRLKREIDNKLNAMRGGSSGADYLQKSHDMLTIIQGMDMRVGKINYRQNQFDVDVSADELSDLDQLKNALIKKGFSAELTSTSKNADGSTLGNLRIK